MLLTDIREHLATHKAAGLDEISAAVNTDRETVKSALDFWIAKGKVTKEILACTGCGKCSCNGDEFYRWVS